MKKLLLILLLTAIQSKAQITLEHTFPIQNMDTSFLYLNIGNDDYKYVIVDYANSKFHIYNLDYTPYQLNITTAQPLSQNNIAYISKNLFDCDDSNLEYVLIENFSDFKVYRTDGTQLFYKNNVIAVYCLGCNNGSLAINPIYNTPAGTKLILSDTNTNARYVYNLCGTLPLGNDGFADNDNFLKVYPVPNDQNGELNFKVNIPANMVNNQIEIYNGTMQLLDTFDVNGNDVTISKNYNFNEGVYFYVFKSGGKIIKTGKMILK